MIRFHGFFLQWEKNAGAFGFPFEKSLNMRHAKNLAKKMNEENT